MLPLWDYGENSMMKKNGSWYSGRTADGGILPDKMCYAHAFVILAATSGVLAKRPGAISF